MAKPTIPANEFISEFDYQLTFDLTEGKIKIKLLGQYIQNAAGITGVKLEITTPTKNKIAPAAFIFNASNFFTTYDVILPRAANAFIFGVYITKLTLVMGSKEYANIKEFNVCAIDSKAPLKGEGVGLLNMVTDCVRRVLKIAGFSGYVYKGVSPSSEDKNLTVFYPTESEKAPQKNISQVPYEVEARNGQYVVKGSNVSTYSFPEEIFVKIKWIAEAKKNVRCGYNLSAIYTAINSVFGTGTHTYNGNKSLCDAWCEVSPLLSLIQLGSSQGIDISDHIEKLEKILTVDCGCSDLGDLVENNVSVPICPQVSDASATVTGFTMVLRWNTKGITNTSQVQIEYRPKSSGENGYWTQLTPSIPASGGVQQFSLFVLITGQYEVKFSVITNNETCPPVYINSNTPTTSDCVDIIDIIGIAAAGSTAGTTQPASPTTVPSGTNDTIYFMAKATAEMPTASEFIASATQTQQNAANDFTIDARIFNADYAYISVAWPNKGAAYQKNQWVENAQDNFGTIGDPGGLFGELTPLLIGGQSYLVSTSLYPTKFMNTQNPVTFKKI